MTSAELVYMSIYVRREQQMIDENFNISPLNSGASENTATDDCLMRVVLYREAGCATVSYAQRRYLERSDNQMPPLILARHPHPSSRDRACDLVQQSRGRRARKNVIDFAVANNLRRSMTLSYADEPDSVEASEYVFSLFLRRLQRHIPELVWLQVTQRGQRHGRLHHHMLVTPDISKQLVAETWRQGRVWQYTRSTIRGIRQQAGYLCADFDLPADKRLQDNRYRRSRTGITPTRQAFIIRQSELKDFLVSLTPQGHHDTWYPPPGTRYHEYTASWDPHA